MHIIEDTILLPNGEASTYVYEHGAGGAHVLIIDNGSAVLSMQYRYPLGRWIYDLPGGGIDAGEDPKETAERESIEEMGLQPKNLKFLNKYYPNPGRTDWPVYLFFCDRTEKINGTVEAHNHEASEDVRKVSVPIAKLEAMIRDGDIVDPGLIIAFYTAKDQKLLL
jgi:ADP-ribose pyrophosphatase